MAISGQQHRETLSERLANAHKALQIDLGSGQQDKLLNYLYELEKWNRTYNLTAIRSLDDMLVQHVFDCLAIIPAIQCYETQQRLRFNLIADIGSGAGLPAVILAIVRPDTSVVSIDSVEKKTAFVQNIANRLGLVNLQARQGRVETMTDIKADLVVSRAFASLQNFLSLSKGLVQDKGVMAAMKSKQLELEIREFNRTEQGWSIHQIDELSVPDMQAKRYLAWLQRNKND